MKILLEEYNFELCHIKGKVNNNPDILSRIYKDNNINVKAQSLQESKALPRYPNTLKLYLNLLKNISYVEDKNNKKILENKIRQIHELLVHSGYFVLHADNIHSCQPGELSPTMAFRPLVPSVPIIRLFLSYPEAQLYTRFSFYQ
ncbi:hypothetical protein DMUE_1004 [Dictyocoela muelleri]|nr:hypothetical protein DMUE_1004 [Dictyocoela muelleri]